MSIAPYATSRYPLCEYQAGVRHLLPRAFETIHNEQDLTSNCECLGIYSSSDIYVADLSGEGVCLRLRWFLGDGAFNF